MSTTYAFYNFSVPQIYTSPEGKVTPVGELVVEYRVTRYRCDGTMRTIDITEVMFGTENVTCYISACQPDKWDELMAAAENNFKSLNNEEVEALNP